MPIYEYKIVPAPEKARKVRGLKGPARFAHAVQEVMNELGAEGWQYLRADTLPQDERSGLTSRTTIYRNLLVFQREIVSDRSEPDPAPAAAGTVPEPPSVPAPAPDTAAENAAATPRSDKDPEPWPGAGPDGDAGPDPDAPLFPNRQGQRVDL